MSVERLPFQATPAAARYEKLVPLPVVVVLENVRSLYNVGSFFRTADGAAVERLYLAGITGHPPSAAISKTALGAEDTVPWEHFQDAARLLDQQREHGCEIAAVETSIHSVDLFDWQPVFPVCAVFGNELEGLSPKTLERCDTFIRIPMLGAKHSLNVAAAGAVVVYELLRKYRSAVDALRPRSR